MRQPGNTQKEKAPLVERNKAWGYLVLPGYDSEKKGRVVDGFRLGVTGIPGGAGKGTLAVFFSGVYWVLVPGLSDTKKQRRV